MVDPNKPIIETRSTLLGGQAQISPKQMPPVNGSQTAGAENKTAPIEPAGNMTSTTTRSATSGAISSTVPATYSASSYDELIPQIEERMSKYRPLSEEELKKLRRRHRAEGIISGVADAAQAVANLYYTHHYAPNMYDAREGMSAKAKARFDREKAEREADEDRWFNYALTLAKLKDSGREQGFRAWMAEQNLLRQDRAFNAGRADRKEDTEARDKANAEARDQWQQTFDRAGDWHKEDGERRDREFKAQLAVEGQRVAQGNRGTQMTFNLGSGNGNVTLPIERLNAQTVSRIYSTLPEDVRKKVERSNPIVQNGYVVGYKQPSTDDMLVAIGANVQTSVETQSAIRQVAGIEKGNKPKGY